MQIQKNDFVYFYDIVAEKTYPLLVTSVKGESIKGYIADASAAFESSRQDREINPDQVRANVGPDPYYWMNKPIELFRGTTDVKKWGVNIWFTPVTERGEQVVEDTIKQFLTLIKPYNLHPFEMETHIVRGTVKDRTIGMYYYKPRSIDVMELKLVNDFISLHVLAHEYAHGLWWRVMSDNQRARWIKLYLKCVDQDSSGDNIQTSVLRDMAEISSVKDLKDLRKSYKDQDIDVGQIISDIFTYMKRAHCLTRKDVTALLDAKEKIADYLPATVQSLKAHAATGVTEYANKEAVEFWCESFALFVQKQELPDFVAKRMKNCLTSLQASRS